MKVTRKKPHANARQSGQGTVEYALIATVLVVIVVALWRLFSLADVGTLIEHTQSSASHSLTSGNIFGVIGDVLLY